MRFQDPDHLRKVQYGDPARLDARIRLHALYGTNPLDFHRWIFEETVRELPPDARLLEVGGGHGRLWSVNADRIPPGWTIALSDFSPGMIGGAARDEALRSHGRITFACLDAQRLPYARAAFDAVCAHFMLYHVPDRERAFREIRRVLKPGGRFYATTLGRGHLREIYELAERVDADVAERAREDWELSFRLDNGPEELAAHFPEVELRRYEDALEITAAEPLSDYVRSLASAEKWGPREVERLREEIDRWLEREGVIRVRKEVGMFSCRRSDR
ncbi:MAG TPA: class I SAM-dependent methyltransferase [Anaerolineales bacterium]|nr:class I SAM-dependent methyltransferase [Anaerolineales bacterium]